MKAIALAALALVAASFAATPVLATPLNPGATSIAPEGLSSVIQVDMKWNGNKNWNGNKKWKYHRRHGNRWHDNNDFSFGLGIGLPLLGYGLGTGYNDGPECTGYWHRHNSGRLHCHGRLIY